MTRDHTDVMTKRNGANRAVSLLRRPMGWGTTGRANAHRRFSVKNYE